MKRRYPEPYDQIDAFGDVGRIILQPAILAAVLFAIFFLGGL